MISACCDDSHTRGFVRRSPRSGYSIPADGFDLSPEGYRFTVQYLLPQKLLLLNGTVSLSWCRSNRAGSLLGWGLGLYHKGLTPVPIDGTHPESRN